MYYLISSKSRSLKTLSSDSHPLWPLWIDITEPIDKKDADPGLDAISNAEVAVVAAVVVAAAAAVVVVVVDEDGLERPIALLLHRNESIITIDECKNFKLCTVDVNKGQANPGNKWLLSLLSLLSLGRPLSPFSMRMSLETDKTDLKFSISTGSYMWIMLVSISKLYRSWVRLSMTSIMYCRSLIPSARLLDPAGMLLSTLNVEDDR